MNMIISIGFETQMTAVLIGIALLGMLVGYLALRWLERKDAKSAYTRSYPPKEDENGQ